MSRVAKRLQFELTISKEGTVWSLIITSMDGNPLTPQHAIDAIVDCTIPDLPETPDLTDILYN